MTKTRQIASAILLTSIGYGIGFNAPWPERGTPTRLREEFQHRAAPPQLPPNLLIIPMEPEIVPITPDKPDYYIV